MAIRKGGPQGQYEDLSRAVSDYSAEAAVRADDNGRGGSIGASLAALVSIVALAFSGYSFYETVLRQASLRVYAPPIIHMYREGYRDVLAIPITISNDGAQRGTVLSFDLTAENLETGDSKGFQNLYFGTSPKADRSLFTPVTVAGRSSYTGIVMFHALETGAFVKTTGGVTLRLRLTLKLNLDKTSGWFQAKPPAPLTFDMTASYIAGFRDMESGTPTALFDVRWTRARDKGAAKE